MGMVVRSGLGIRLFTRLLCGSLLVSATPGSSDHLPGVDLTPGGTHVSELHVHHDHSSEMLGTIVLDGSDFTDASFDGAELIGASLIGTVLVRTAMDFARLTGAVLSNADLEATQLDFADLDGAVLDGVGCSGGCSSTSFANATLRGASMQGADLDGADFDSADLSGAAPTGPGLVAASLAGADFFLATLDELDGGCAEGVPANECVVLADADFRFASLRDARLMGADLTPSSAGSSNFFDADLTRADLSRVLASAQAPQSPPLPPVDCTGQPFVLFEDAIVAGARFESARLACANFAGASTGVTADCAGPGPFDDPAVDERCADFTRADLRGAVFDDASIRGALMSGAILLGASLVDADLSQSDLAGAKLADAVLTNASLAGVDLTLATLLGADFSLGAVDAGSDCTPAAGNVPVDLKGATLVNANFSTSLHFLRGCIDVDATTTYSAATLFPPNFGNLIDDMTLVPEPSAPLQLFCGGLGLLVLYRRRTARSTYSARSAHSA